VAAKGIKRVKGRVLVILWMNDRRVISVVNESEDVNPQAGTERVGGSAVQLKIAGD